MNERVEENGLYSLEIDGALFEYKGRTEFDAIYRHDDGSTKIQICGIWLLVEKDETLFNYNGATEFEDIKRFDNGSTKLTLTTVVEAGEKQ